MEEDRRLTIEETSVEVYITLLRHFRDRFARQGTKPLSAAEEEDIRKEWLTLTKKEQARRTQHQLCHNIIGGAEH